MAARSRLCFWLLVLGFHLSIIFHKFSANSHDLSKIKPPRTDNLYLYNHMEENEADGIGLRWYIKLGQSEYEWFCNSCKIQRENSSRSEECINDQVSEDLYQEIKDRINGSGISVGHVNIRGLVKNLNELRILLNYAKFDVIGITETHLTEDVDSKEVHVKGYVLHCMDRQKNKQGGGCAVYVK